MISLLETLKPTTLHNIRPGDMYVYTSSNMPNQKRKCILILSNGRVNKIVESSTMTHVGTSDYDIKFYGHEEITEQEINEAKAHAKNIGWKTD